MSPLDAMSEVPAVAFFLLGCPLWTAGYWSLSGLWTSRSTMYDLVECACTGA